MRSRLRLFLLVGLFVTALDVLLFLWLGDRARQDSSIASLPGIEIVALVVLSVAISSVVSYGLNRLITFRGFRDARWVRNPGSFAATALVGAAIDALVTTTVIRAGVILPYGSGLVARVVGIFSAAAVRWLVYRWVLFNEVRRELAERRERPRSDCSFRLGVVVPAYNEAGTIANTVAQLKSTLEPLVGATELEILVVDDGSVDDTVARASQAGARVIEQPENRGKGAAVRAGILAADARSVVFTDADLAYPPELIGVFLAELEAGWDVAVGSRRHTETTTLVKARRVRELGGRAINLLTHLVLLGHFRDTQCGIKGFRGDIGKVIFERTTIDGFAFDVEVLLIAEQDSLSLTEVPVSVENRQGSSVRLVADTVSLFRDLIRIRRMAGWGRYRPNQQQQAVIDGTSAAGSAVDDSDRRSGSDRRLSD